MTPFETEVVQLASDARLLTVRGEIRAYDVDTLREVAMGAQARRFLIDTTAADVEDPGVVELLLDLAQRARPVDLVAVVVPDGSVLHGVLETTGLDTALTTYPTLRAVLDDLDLPSPGEL